MVLVRTACYRSSVTDPGSVLPLLPNCRPIESQAQLESVGKDDEWPVALSVEGSSRKLLLNSKLV